MTTKADVRRLEKLAGEVIAQHKRKGDIAEYSRYKNDPVGFLVEVLHADPWSVQREIAELVRDHPRVVVRSANSCGKGWLAVMLALWWTYTVGGLVVFTSATLRQLRIGAMRELRMAFSRATELPGTLFEESLRIDDRESGIYAFTASDASRWQGIHHEHLLIVLDEAQGLEPEIYEAAVACVPERTLALGNPLKPIGDFYRICHSDSWRSVKIAADDHPNIVENRPVIPGGPTAEWVQTMADEYGASGSIYRARVLGEFPTESIEGLVRREWLRAAFDRHGENERGDAHLMPRPIMALDVARFGPDKTALSVVQGSIVREIVTWHGASITDTVDRVIEHGRAVQARDIWNRRPTVWVDEPGLGGGAIDVLKRKGYPTRAFNGAERSSDPSRWLNKRAESFWFFRTSLEDGTVALPADRLVEEEALAVEWQISASGAIQILGKDLIRKELGRSPDRLDAVVIGLCAAMGGIRGPTVSFEGIAI